MLYVFKIIYAHMHIYVCVCVCVYIYMKFQRIGHKEEKRMRKGRHVFP